MTDMNDIHSSIKIQRVLGFDGVITCLKDNDRHTFIFCKVCGTQVVMDEKRIQ